MTLSEQKQYDSIEIGDLYEYRYGKIVSGDIDIVLIVDKYHFPYIDIVYLANKKLYKTPMCNFALNYRKIA